MSPLRGGLEELEEDILAYKDIIKLFNLPFLNKNSCIKNTNVNLCLACMAGFCLFACLFVSNKQ